MRILAIDYGKKRTGLAVSDPLRIIAQGLTTVDTHMALVFLRDYFSKELVDTIVVGEPLNLDGTPTDATAPVTEFVKKLKRHFPDKVIVMVDERFSSKMASRAMVEMGMKKKDRENKALIDEMSATLLLQDYMQSLEK